MLQNPVHALDLFAEKIVALSEESVFPSRFGFGPLSRLSPLLNR
jgi:hypothetical protein